MSANSTLGISAEFFLGKLHARWGSAWQGVRLRGLADNLNAEQLQQALAPFGADLRDPVGVARRLNLHLLAELDSVARLLPSAAAAFYGAFSRRYYLQNLKTLLHHCFLPAPGADLALLLPDEAAMLPHLPVALLLAAPTAEEFCGLLPGTPEKRALYPIVKALVQSRDAFAADTAIDALYFSQCRRAVEDMPRSLRETARDLCQLEIDIINALALLRNARVYRVAGDLAAEWFIPGGRCLTAELFARLSQAVDPVLVEESLPAALRRPLRNIARRDLAAREQALWSDFFAAVLLAFRNLGNPAASVVAYPFLMRGEILNLCRLYDGWRLHLPLADIRGMLVGTGAYV